MDECHAEAQEHLSDLWHRSDIHDVGQIRAPGPRLDLLPLTTRLSRLPEHRENVVSTPCSTQALGASEPQEHQCVEVHADGKPEAWPQSQVMG